ncbi:MAG: DUF1990 family protein [Actinomycetota bacterium]|nr:DUF1990 family protein [Actinomycetota bacterium]
MRFPFRCQSGPLRGEDRRCTHPLTDAGVVAAIADGLTPTDDFNGASQEGVGRYQVTVTRAVGGRSRRPTSPPPGDDRTCRVASVVDEPDTRGFSYGSLPGHPE